MASRSRRSNVQRVFVASKLTQQRRVFVFKQTLDQTIWHIGESPDLWCLETVSWLQTSCKHASAFIKTPFPNTDWTHAAGSIFETVWFALANSGDAMRFKLSFDNITQVETVVYDRNARTNDYIFRSD
jgi:hypothetical protein